jgi:Ca2+-binding RTX toxin-like protein
MPDVFQGDTDIGSNGGETFVVQEDLFAGTLVDGNGGDDTLDADGAWTIADAVSLLDLEILALDTDLLTLSTTDFASFEDITGSGAATQGLVALTPGGVASATVEVLGLDELEVQASSLGDRLFFITPLGSPPAEITVFGNEGDDVIDTGAGADRLHGSENDDTLDGNGGADRLFGEKHEDTLIVRSEAVEFNGGGGADTFVLTEQFIDQNPVNGTVLVGGTGTDTLMGAAAGTSWIIEPTVTIQGIETLALDLDSISMASSQLAGFATIVNDAAATSGELALSSGGTARTDVTGLTTLSVDVVGDFFDVYRLTFTTGGAVKTDITVEGAAVADRLITGDGDDTLAAFGGDDTLKGNGGVDRLDGGDDDDRLTGGDDSDFFVFTGTFGQDVVTDFGTGVDRFDLDPTWSFATLAISGVDSDADGAADDVRVAAGADRFDVLNTSLASIDPSDFLF